MLNMKKILVTGTVLTAFCTSAFAASADCQPQPSMSERVNAILHENDADRPCPPPAHKMHRQGPKLTPEQRAERQKMREEWKSMTPEQREAIKANRPMPPKPPKHHKGEYRGYKHHKEEFHGHRHHNGEFPQPPQN